jgi:hypothetical protein
MDDYENLEKRREDFINKFGEKPTNGKVILYLFGGCIKFFFIWILIVLCLIFVILIQIGVIK